MPLEDENVHETRLPQKLLTALDECWVLIDDTITKEQNILDTNQRNDELKSKLAAELKLNMELKEMLQQISKNSNELDKMCNKFDSVNIKESDQSRLNNAQEMLKIGKEYTGIRWDYTAPPDVVKGYVKNSNKMMLECFEYKLDEKNGSTVAANLWKYVGSAASTNWQDLITGRVVEKENVRSN